MTARVKRGGGRRRRTQLCRCRHRAKRCRNRVRSQFAAEEVAIVAHFPHERLRPPIGDDSGRVGVGIEVSHREGVTRGIDARAVSGQVKHLKPLVKVPSPLALDIAEAVPFLNGPGRSTDAHVQEMGVSVLLIDSHAEADPPHVFCQPSVPSEKYWVTVGRCSPVSGLRQRRSVSCRRSADLKRAVIIAFGRNCIHPLELGADFGLGQLRQKDVRSTLACLADTAEIGRSDKPARQVKAPRPRASPSGWSSQIRAAAGPPAQYGPSEIAGGVQLGDKDVPVAGWSASCCRRLMP